VIPLASISERDQRGGKGGSGYGRVGFVEAGNVRAEKGSEMCFPPYGSYSLYRGEDFYREARIGGSWDVIGIQPLRQKD